MSSSDAVVASPDGWSFSQPFGPSPLYGPPPYAFRGARTITSLVRFDGAAIAPYLPPAVNLTEVQPLGIIAASHYPDTELGSYHELSFFVRATALDRTFMFSPLMYADGDGAVAAGRELWGFAKKVATMALTEAGEYWRFTADRNGHRIADVRFRPQQQGTPDALAAVDFPTLTLRLIPSRTGRGRPDIAQLISTSNLKRPCTANGMDARWVGTSDVSILGTASDPVTAFSPVEMVSSWMTEYDCDLPAGDLVHDYREAEKSAPTG
ncbi:acetoacetate decarboxylase [Nocardioides sp. AN3]